MKEDIFNMVIRSPSHVLFAKAKKKAGLKLNCSEDKQHALRIKSDSCKATVIESKNKNTKVDMKEMSFKIKFSLRVDNCVYSVNTVNTDDVSSSAAKTIEKKQTSKREQVCTCVVLV